MTSVGLGIVTARRGSKRLPRKNLQTIRGETLVALAVRSGLESGCCDRVVCSTDDDEIAESARMAGAEVILRPDHLAQDDTLSTDVVLHVLGSYGCEWPWFVLLQPTSPLRTAHHVRDAVAELTAGVDAVVSVCRARVHPFKHLVDDGRGGWAPARAITDLSAPDQILPAAWHPNGAVYVCRPAAFQRHRTFFPPGFRIYRMDDEHSIDIDTAADLRDARNAAESPNRRTYGNERESYQP